MRKVFISVPMRGREWPEVLQSIDKLTELAKETFGADCEIVSSIVKEKPNEQVQPTSTGLWYLGESLKIMSQADAFIGFDEGLMTYHGYNGCAVETKCANDYKLQTKIFQELDSYCPDIV